MLRQVCFAASQALSLRSGVPGMLLEGAARGVLDTHQTAGCSGRLPLEIVSPGARLARHQHADATATGAQPAPGSNPDLTLRDSAVKRIKELQAESPGGPVLLRIEVEGGGCSGFQYIFKLDTAVTEEDRVFEKDGAKLVCDTVSLEFLRGAAIEFEDNLMRSAFQVASNPNSESTCGCGSSFVAKV